MILVAYRHGFRPAELVDLISPTAVSIVIMKIPERPRNPNFPAPEGPIFTRLRNCGSFQRNTLHIVSGLATLTREA